MSLQIYSLLPLAAWVPLRKIEPRIVISAPQHVNGTGALAHVVCVRQRANRTPLSIGDSPNPKDRVPRDNSGRPKARASAGIPALVRPPVTHRQQRIDAALPAALLSKAQRISP